MEMMLPPELKEPAIAAIMACKDVRKCATNINENGTRVVGIIIFFFSEFGYKDPCDRTFYSTKCVYDYDPGQFMFP